MEWAAEDAAEHAYNLAQWQNSEPYTLNLKP